jgi:hypothetical protein
MRELAKTILATRGHRIMTPDGIFVWTYRDDEIRISLQPAVAGASMPAWLDIWRGAVKVFSMIWFVHPGDGHPEVLRDKPDADLEAALQAVQSRGQFPAIPK